MYSVGFVGIGGQGMLFAAELLAEVAFRSGYYVAQLQSYGAEVRGGSVIAYTIIDSKPIENPFLEGFDLAIVLHSGGLKRWSRYVERSRVVIVDRDLVEYSGEAYRLPIVNKAIELGVHGSENVVAVGIAIALAPMKLYPSIAEEILGKRRRSEVNIKALRLGLELGEKLAAELSRS